MAAVRQAKPLTQIFYRKIRAIDVSPVSASLPNFQF
jgi:hypothetical protein